MKKLDIGIYKLDDHHLFFVFKDMDNKLRGIIDKHATIGKTIYINCAPVVALK